jgi:hypothetical protein
MMMMMGGGGCRVMRWSNSRWSDDAVHDGLALLMVVGCGSLVFRGV